MNKYTARGALLGMLFGFLVLIMSPYLRTQEAIMQGEANKTMGFPENFYSIKSGTIYLGNGILAFLSGCIGGVCGWIYARIQRWWNPPPPKTQKHLFSMLFVSLALLPLVPR